MASKKFNKFQQSLFARSARMMSHELRVNRTYYEARKPKKYKRTCEYCMHVQYNEILVELTEVLQR